MFSDVLYKNQLYKIHTQIQTDILELYYQLSEQQELPLTHYINNTWHIVWRLVGVQQIF